MTTELANQTTTFEDFDQAPVNSRVQIQWVLFAESGPGGHKCIGPFVLVQDRTTTAESLNSWQLAQRTTARFELLRFLEISKRYSCPFPAVETQKCLIGFDSRVQQICVDAHIIPPAQRNRLNEDCAGTVEIQGSIPVYQVRKTFPKSTSILVCVPPGLRLAC